MYAILMAILLLVFTFSAVKRHRTLSEISKPVRKAVSTKTDLEFLNSSDSKLSEVRLEKIQPLLSDSNRQHLNLPARDPFWPVSVTPKPVFFMRHRESKPTFRLEGIIAKGRSRKAIVNGKVVRIGDRVGSAFRVKLITDNLVVLTSLKRDIYLHF